MLYLITKGDTGEKMDYRFFIVFITSTLIFSLVVFADHLLIAEDTGKISTGEQQSGGVNLTVNATATTTTSTTVATTATTSAPSGGGGGGGAATIITTEETKTISLVPAGGSTIVTITKSDTLKIDLIEIEVKNEVKNVQVTVKESSKPAGATVVIGTEGKVYKYLEITTTISKTDISRVKVRFKVEKSWISNNGIDPNTIALNKLANTSWEKLATKKVSEDTINVFYEAEMSSLSIFAVTGQISTAITMTTVTTTLLEITVTTLPRVTTTTLEIVRPTDVTLLIVLVVVAILVILALILRRR